MSASLLVVGGVSAGVVLAGLLLRSDRWREPREPLLHETGGCRCGGTGIPVPHRCGMLGCVHA